MYRGKSSGSSALSNAAFGMQRSPLQKAQFEVQRRKAAGKPYAGFQQKVDRLNPPTRMPQPGMSPAPQQPMSPAPQQPSGPMPFDKGGVPAPGGAGGEYIGRPVDAPQFPGMQDRAMGGFPSFGGGSSFRPLPYSPPGGSFTGGVAGPGQGGGDVSAMPFPSDAQFMPQRIPQGGYPELTQALGGGLMPFAKPYRPV